MTLAIAGLLLVALTGYLARFIVPHLLTGAENRTTRVLPNPDNSLAYDSRDSAIPRLAIVGLS
jgi:hypothetical protein